MLDSLREDLSTFHYCRRHKTRHKNALVEGNGIRLLTIAEEA